MVGNTPVPPEALPINVASHSIEMMLSARVILDHESKPATIILTGNQGVELKFPGFAYPFVKNGAQVLAIVSVVQVSPAEPTLKPKLLIAGK